MIKILFKTVMFLVMGTAIIGGTLKMTDVSSSWRYEVASAVGPGTSITINHPHEGEPVHAEVPVLLSTTKTVDLGGPATLIGAYALAVLTGFFLRGSRRPVHGM